MPQPPKTCGEILKHFGDAKIMNHFGKTCHETPRTFYKGAYDGDAFTYCVFASDTIIEAIETYIRDIKHRRYLMDATFKVCPSGVYNQLLIIYVEFLGEVSTFSYFT